MDNLTTRSTIPGTDGLQIVEYRQAPPNLPNTPDIVVQQA